MTEMTCRFAALCGHLNMLKYAHEEGCPWDKRTCSRAAEEGHKEVLEWAIANGCPEPIDDEEYNENKRRLFKNPESDSESDHDDFSAY